MRGRVEQAHAVLGKAVCKVGTESSAPKWLEPARGRLITAASCSHCSEQTDCAVPPDQIPAPTEQSSKQLLALTAGNAIHKPLHHTLPDRLPLHLRLQFLIPCTRAKENQVTLATAQHPTHTKFKNSCRTMF